MSGRIIKTHTHRVNEKEKRDSMRMRGERDDQIAQTQSKSKG